MTHLLIKNTAKVRRKLIDNGFILCARCFENTKNDMILRMIDTDLTKFHSISSVQGEDGRGLPLAIHKIGIENIFDCGEDVELFINKLKK